MRVFYGVQGTGNGHITRARMMAKELYQAGVEVTFLFTGREAAHYFDMDIFQQYQAKSGLTFSVHEGQVQYFKTAVTAKPLQFFKEVASLDLTAYDLVISDFEPVTAWAAKTRKKTVLGIGHQYAFNHPIPIAGSDPLARGVMKYFAPVDIGVGLHWHHFGQPILPPIIETPALCATINKSKIIVYLPFEEQDAIIRLLTPFTNFDFHVYTPASEPSGFQHIQCKPLSREAFKQDFYDCAGIISNAGFELASEALQAGKKILAKPLHAQMEQISNAFALKQLGFGQTMFDLDVKVVEAWLYTQRAVRVTYPNVAQIVVQWIVKGMPEMNDEFIASVWSQVNVLQIQQ
ncbi:MAG: glycosyltransferase [Methylococcaceae bacterium]|nr:glycosyltransferase [Methylococcaceae bacterium]